MGEYNPEGFLQHGYVYNGISAPTQSSLQQWLREYYNIYLESKQLPYGDTEWTVVNSSGKVLIESKAYMYYDGYPKKDHLAEHEGLELVLRNALTLIKL